MLAKELASHNRLRKMSKEQKKKRKTAKKLRKRVPIFAIF